jgi:hypothetical protein
VTFTVTRRRLGDLIKSVKRDVAAVAQAVQDLERVLAAFDRLREHDKRLSDKHLALAFGVTTPSVSGWRKIIARDDPGRGPNVEIREAIKGLADSGRAWGLQVAVDQMRGTVEDLEAALDVRRALSDALGQGPRTTTEERAAAAAAFEKAISDRKGGGSEAKKKRRSK